jgi:hypothetical protein
MLLELIGAVPRNAITDQDSGRRALGTKSRLDAFRSEMFFSNVCGRHSHQGPEDSHY